MNNGPQQLTEAARADLAAERESAARKLAKQFEAVAGRRPKRTATDRGAGPDTDANDRRVQGEFLSCTPLQGKPDLMYRFLNLFGPVE